MRYDNIYNMSKNGAGYDPEIEDVPGDLYPDEKTLFVKMFITYVSKNKKFIPMVNK